MQSDIAVGVDHVTKTFKVYLDKGSTLKEKILFKNRRKYSHRVVLDDISFEIRKGEAVGLIGENGCGKSTTLKLLTRIMYPDTGTITMNGRVSSLIELGAGFHPDMSGRQNIYINASIFGLTKKEIDARLDDIIAFSELEEFIDNPVRTYSSGMYMRLAFSVAINVDADILLIDEILAVGDANFQAKCFDKLRELKASGMTIVLVTHDTGTIERFCNRAIWILDGRIASEGAAPRVVDSYLKYMNQQKLEKLGEKNKSSVETGNEVLADQSIIVETNVKEQLEEQEQVDMIDFSANHFGLNYIIIEKAQIRNDKSEITTVLPSGMPCSFEIYNKVNKPLEEYVFGIGIFDLDGRCIVGNNTQLDRLHIPHTKMNGKVCFHIDKLPLLSGKYVLNVAIVNQDGAPMDYYRDYCHFDVVSDDRSVGVVHLDHSWEVQ